ncbi:PREDICTED: vesicle-associated membrane protein 8-like [Gavialis gangeticus]|uniref:vesicle-associated membrane protein 8-like n=1 Tax=Gavialis gangeticus TaxID=94835 RepID=UPI00092E3A98|nr:PREDICTED: vesicle-associated membrane protein 8-like [Gavialis gangeticus]
MPVIENKNASDTISTLQIQVDDVKNVMTKNIDKVLQREEKLSELVDRTDDLQTVADAFQKTSTKISRKMWWKNFKVIILIVIFLLILTFIILLATGVIPT